MDDAAALNPDASAGDVTAFAASADQHLVSMRGK
jgi:hypothetical protein